MKNAMAQPTSLKEIELTPSPGKQYFNLNREWREEFIYFLMVDRFHDDTNRKPLLKPDRCQGVKTPDDFYGGKIKGITQNLDYIAGLGCTAIWLSPVFGNNDGAYHGYNINNYLDIDPRLAPSRILSISLTRPTPIKRTESPALFVSSLTSSSTTQETTGHIPADTPTIIATTSNSLLGIGEMAKNHSRQNCEILITTTGRGISISGTPRLKTRTATL